MKRTRLNKKGKSSVSQLRNKCDKLLQENNRRDFRFCEVCGRENQVAHHFFPKSTSSRLRYDWCNIIQLCHSCHFAHHTKGDPSIHAKIIEHRGLGWYEELNITRRELIKVNIGYFEGILKELENENNT